MFYENRYIWDFTKICCFKVTLACRVQVITDADNCDQCLRCVSACPCGIIDKDTISVKDEDLALCMGCRACMHVCKNCTRGFPQKVHQAIAERMAMIKAANSERKPNVLSLATPS